jgi:hypothetical protein
VPDVYDDPDRSSQMARSKAQKAQKTLTETAEGVRDTVVPAAQDAATGVASAVGPALADAKDKIAPLLEEARDAIVPAAQAALVAAKDKSHDVAVNSGLVEEKKKSHKLRNFLIVVGLGGAIAFAYKRLSGKDADPVWTQSRDEAASPRPTGAAAGPVDGSDTAPTAPLASEETVESPVPSTPDAPLEERNV